MWPHEYVFSTLTHPNSGILKQLLTDMEIRETGTVAEILGGQGVPDRLRALGVRPGVKITKISAVSTRGPVVVQVGGTQISFGFGISYKIIVAVER